MNWQRLKEKGVDGGLGKRKRDSTDPSSEATRKRSLRAGANLKGGDGKRQLASNGLQHPKSTAAVNDKLVKSKRVPCDQEDKRVDKVLGTKTKANAVSRHVGATSEDAAVKGNIAESIDLFGADDAERRLDVSRQMSILDSVLSQGESTTHSDDVIRNEPGASTLHNSQAERKLSQASQKKLGKYLGIDCEMVGVGPDGIQSSLARISIVNYHGHVVLDQYVIPETVVEDYRTHVSGITPDLLDPMKNPAAKPFKEVRQAVAALMKDRIVIGHALRNDFKVLFLKHPPNQTRDTSRYGPFREMAKGRSPALRRLARDLLGITIQEGEHSSVEDARVTMLLYRKVKAEWERMFIRSNNAQ